MNNISKKLFNEIIDKEKMTIHPMFSNNKIIKVINKSVTAEKFLKIIDNFKCKKPKIENIKKLDNGDLLASIVDPKKGIITNYFFKSIFIRKFNFPYSCHKDIKGGKELLISNIKLPPVKF